uniref:Uncharacterized protein n=1 Tax=Kalanchoe fedtschenkoi TaxID=63787 RepID=A0A7N0VFB8_KALFE
MRASNSSDPFDPPFPLGGLFLDAVPISFASLISSQFTPDSDFPSASASCLFKRDPGVAVSWTKKRSWRRVSVNRFLSVSLYDDDGGDDGSSSIDRLDRERNDLLARCGEVEVETKSGASAFNTTKHLWAGAVAAMVSRTFVAPLERLKLEYIVRGDQRSLPELIKTIAATQGIQDFLGHGFRRSYVTLYEEQTNHLQIDDDLHDRDLLSRWRKKMLSLYLAILLGSIYLHGE